MDMIELPKKHRFTASCGSDTDWTTTNPILKEGESVIVTYPDRTPRCKIGDGTNTYTALPFTDRYAHVSVREYGAKGDGIADDSVAIQNAINSGSTYVEFPPGTYQVTEELILKPNQTLYGAGVGRTIIRSPQTNIATPHKNMFISTVDLFNVTVRDMTLKGSRQNQTTVSTTGQDMAAFSIRAGSVRWFTLENLSIEHFGDKSGVGGGGLILGALSGSSKFLSDITIRGCTFMNIANVPGVYINADSSYYIGARNIKIINNTFIIEGQTADQNAVYILGTSTLPVDGVHVDGNSFYASMNLDCFIELNHTRGWSVNNNHFLTTSTGNSTPILIRDNAVQGTICNNTLINAGTGNTSNYGISLVRQYSTFTQEEIVISGNVIKGYGNGINISTGSKGVRCSDNIITGKSDTTKMNAAISVASSDTITLSNNMSKYANYGVILGVVDKVVIDSNRYDYCGDGVVCIVGDGYPGQAITNLSISNNIVTNVNSGTPNFVSVNSAANTGNKYFNNNIPSTINPVNQSYLAKFESIIRPASGRGEMIAGLRYSFDQGPLPMAHGQGFTIGANLDSWGADCALGDTILVGCSQPLQGVLAMGYVEDAGKIRIRVQNETGASVTIAAANWKVVVLKTSL